MLRARFEDARFFYEDDLAKPLAEFRPLLQGTVFHKALGTLLDKSVRVWSQVALAARADVRPGLTSFSQGLVVLVSCEGVL